MTTSTRGSWRASFLSSPAWRCWAEAAGLEDSHQPHAAGVVRLVRRIFRRGLSEVRRRAPAQGMAVHIYLAGGALFQLAPGIRRGSVSSVVVLLRAGHPPA